MRAMVEKGGALLLRAAVPDKRNVTSTLKKFNFFKTPHAGVWR